MNLSIDINAINVIRRGKGLVLLHNGYEYVKNRQYKNLNIIWFCNKRHKNKCTGNITTSSDNTRVVLLIAHKDDCVPNINQNMIDIVMAQCYASAAYGRITVQQAFNQGISYLMDLGIHLTGTPLPKFSERRSAMFRFRNKTLNVAAVRAKSVNEVEIPNTFLSFLLGDYNHDGIRILIFCHNDIRPRLQRGHYFMDGTFSACPNQFGQLFTIHYEMDDDPTKTNVIPAIYVLLSDKKFKTYSILFEMLKTLLPNLEPTKITVDFERAVITAMRNKFPNAIIRGCYFHFVKAITKKAKTIGLSKLSDKKIIVQLTCRLPLLPIQKIKDGWNFIISEMENSEVEKKFKSYVESYWFKNNFEWIWCVFDENHRTNNVSESWNRKLNRQVKKNPNIIQLLHSLLDDATVTLLGTNQTNRRKNILLKDIRIREAQLKLLDGLWSTEYFLT